MRSDGRIVGRRRRAVVVVNQSSFEIRQLGRRLDVLGPRKSAAGRVAACAAGTRALMATIVKDWDAARARAAAPGPGARSSPCGRSSAAAPVCWPPVARARSRVAAGSLRRPSC